MMNRWLAALFVCALSTPAVAQDAPLEGFGDVKLGMPFKQLEATHRLKDKQVISALEGLGLQMARIYAPNADISYNDIATETLRGQTVFISYGIQNDIVQQITLWISGPTDPAGCARMVDEFAPMFADKYGKLDGSPTQSVVYTSEYATITKTAASKSWPDRMLVIGAYHRQSTETSNCELAIDYLLSIGGNAAKKI